MANARKTPRRIEPVRITTAPESHRDDLDRRRRRYVISMAIRSLCFIGAVAVGPGYLRWVLIAGAVFLPYLAVVAANSEGTRVPGTDLPTGTTTHRELT